MSSQKITQIMTIFFIIFSASYCSATIHLQGEIHHPKTSDNWDLTLEHHSPRKNTVAKKYPVIICHGLVGNRNYFKIKEEESIVYRLISNGYDVWLLDLRGRKDAGTPSLFFGDKKYDYSFDDYAIKDVDAAISYVLDKTKAEKVNWIGHSMGGMVVYTRLGTFKENRIANLVTLGSPFSFPNTTKYLKAMSSNFTFLLRVLPVIPSANLAHMESDYKIPLPKKGAFVASTPEFLIRSTPFGLERVFFAIPPGFITGKQTIPTSPLKTSGKKSLCLVLTRYSKKSSDTLTPIVSSP
jgi:pimeloyl-ACP methyl ester carboxylesterase